MMKKAQRKSVVKKKIRVITVAKKSGSAIHSSYKLPDLTEFRKTIHVRGEPLSRMIIKSRG